MFSRISRYPPRSRWSPREDSLTESFGAVVDLTEGLADALASHWGIESRGRKWAVSSQALTGAGLDKVDLELAGEGALIWVEVKHGSPLSEGQLGRYRRALDARDVPDRKLILLAPEEFDFADPEVRHAHKPSTWQEIGSLLHDQGASEPRGNERWLLEQFVRFLGEEGLLVTESFSHTYLEAVRHRSDATKSFQDLLRRSHEKIVSNRGIEDDRWPARWPHGVLKDWPTFWAIWSEPDYGEEARFEWALNTEVDGRLLFGAGLTVDRPHEETSLLGDEEWWKPLCEQKGFEKPCLIDNDVWRLFRRKDPETLISGSPSRADQSRDLSQWVIETFAALEASRRLI